MRRRTAPASSAYVAGLRLLARRELSEHQLNRRLLARGYAAEDAAAALDRLRAERAIDDTRAAGALARHVIHTRRHGRQRAQRELEQAGISPAVARSAIDQACAGLDPTQLVEAALARRLRGDRPIADVAEFRRLYRVLVSQGFEPELIVKALRARASVRNDALE
jgi:regulatory protein